MIKCVIIHADLNRKGRDHLDAGKGPRVSGEKKFSPLSFEVHMENNVLSISGAICEEKYIRG